MLPKPRHLRSRLQEKSLQLPLNHTEARRVNLHATQRQIPCRNPARKAVGLALRLPHADFLGGGVWPEPKSQRACLWRRKIKEVEQINCNIICSFFLSNTVTTPAYRYLVMRRMPSQAHYLPPSLTLSSPKTLLAAINLPSMPMLANRPSRCIASHSV
jgi:hypothetical protein